MAMHGENGGSPDAVQLSSWKAIASFLGRDERTVKRWEGTRGLPVRRLPGSGRAAVFAYVHELKAWQDSARDGGDPTRATTGLPLAARSYALLALAVIAVLPVAAWLIFHTGSDSSAGHTPRTRDAVAAELYLSGLHEWQTRTPSGLARAVTDFNNAIRRDPNFAQAYVGLANTYDLMREFTLMPPKIAYGKAAAAAGRAITLDPSLADAHSALAFSDFYWRRNPTAAEREFRRAIELDPANASAHHWYATFLMTMGDFRRARDEIEKATRLDPESTAIIADKALIVFYGGDARNAATLLKQIEADQPQFASPHLYLSGMDLIGGRDESYLREMKLEALSLHDVEGAATADAGAKGFARGGHLGMLHALLERRLALYAQGKATAYDIAQNYALLGDRDKAIGYLSTSLWRNEPEIVGMKINPLLAPLRNMPAYEKLLLKSGLAAHV